MCDKPYDSEQSTVVSGTDYPGILIISSTKVTELFRWLNTL